MPAYKLQEIYVCFSREIALYFSALQQKKEVPLSKNLLFIAERQGFEPWEQLPVHRISSAARSTTPASFLIIAAQK